MKPTLKRLVLLALVVATAGVLATCNLTPVSIADRIQSFVASLNGDRSDTHKNFEIATAGYLTDSTYWNILLTGSTPPYSYPAPNTSNPSAVLVTITGATGPSYNFKLIMVNTGTVSENWMIQHLEFPPGTQIL